MLYATGSAGLAPLVRGSSRRITIMRFRPANIRLINRRSNLPRLLLALFSKNGKSNNNDKNNHSNVQELTGSLHIRAVSIKVYPSEQYFASLWLPGESAAIRADGTSIFRRSSDTDRRG